MGGWPKRGDIVAGRYRVEETLGSGGMGTVVAAIDLRSTGRVAVKLPRAGADARRFVVEARAAQGLHGENIARVLDSGATDDGTPFIAFEYLDGADLGRWLAVHGKLAPATAAAIIGEACTGVAEAHARGIVHRDLKPSNLFLTIDGTVKVLDFGIAKLTMDDATTTGGLVGSPAYMPPERMRPSTAIDGRGDIWALGVVLHEALAGHRPFTSPAFPDLCLQILLDDPPALDASVPEGLAAIVQRCLAKEPADRFQDALELGRALAPFAETAIAISAVDLELLAVRSPHDEQTLAPAPRSSRKRWRHASVAVAFGTVLALVPATDQPPASVEAITPAAANATTAISVTAGPIVAPPAATPPASEPPVASTLAPSPIATPPRSTARRITKPAHPSAIAIAPAIAVAPTATESTPTPRDPLASPF